MTIIETYNTILFEQLHLLILNNQLNLLNPICPLCHDKEAVKILKNFTFLMLSQILLRYGKV